MPASTGEARPTEANCTATETASTSNWARAAASAADMATTAKTTTTESSSASAVGTRPRGKSKCHRRDAG